MNISRCAIKRGSRDSRIWGRPLYRVDDRDQHIYLYAFALTGEKRVLNDG